MGKFLGFFRLSRQKKRIVLEALVVVATVRTALWVVPFRHIRKRIDLDSAEVTAGSVDWKFVEHAAASVRAVSHYVPRASCLTQAISMRLLLRRKRLPARIRIGVDREKAPVFEAHAWVEVADRIVIGRLPRHHQRFSVLKPSELGSR